MASLPNLGDMPAFVIRDLDKQPHSPVTYRTRPDLPRGTSQLMTPVPTPEQSPKVIEDGSSGMTRSNSDLSAHSGNSIIDNAHNRTVSSGSQSSRMTSQFPFTNIFKWKRTISSSSTPSFMGMHTPPIDESSARTSDYFSDPGLKGVQITNLDNLGHSIQAQKNELNAALETKLQEERRLRHLAEDRLTEVEEEITRLCTVILPSDNGETGEAYFASIIESVRIAIDSYESRTNGLEQQLEEKCSLLITERRERTNVDIECTALRNQLKTVQKELLDLQTTAASNAVNEEMSQENRELREEVNRLRLEASAVSDLKKKLQVELREAETAKQIAQESANKVSDREDSERAGLLQRVKDTEAQRDALRQVSRGLRQRLTIETRKNAERTKALAAMDQTFTARTHTRSTSRQGPENTSPCRGGSSDSDASKFRQHDRKESLNKIVEGLSINRHPRFEPFSTTLEAPRGRMIAA